MPGVRILTAILVWSVIFLLSPARLPAETPRAPQLAGSWYPAVPGELRRTVEDFLAAAPAVDTAGRLLAIVSPHAGYAYSGPTAGRAWKALQGRDVATVVVVAPSHRLGFEGVAVYDLGPLATPLGNVALDAPAIAALQAAEPLVRTLPEAFEGEHALEIQLPFMQVVAPGARLVPLIMGRQTKDTVSRLGQALAGLARDKPVVLAASTDLSHFHSAADAARLDGRLAQDLSRLDTAGLSACLADGSCEACGGGPLLAVLEACRLLGAKEAELLGTAHSGQLTGDSGSVVGYLAAAVILPEAPAATTGPAGLSAADKAALRRIAEESVAAAVLGAKPPARDGLSPALRAPGAAFVTLKKNGELRGCIGQVAASGPLAESVAHMAAAAALDDPRFVPVLAAELADITVEVSVLTPFRPLERPEDVVVGRDGLMVERGFRSGLLLPQVPVELGWGREEFLDQTCRKAGLPRDCWRDPSTTVSVFSAEVF